MTHRCARFTGETSFPRVPPSAPLSVSVSLLSPNKFGSATNYRRCMHDGVFHGVHA